MCRFLLYSEEADCLCCEPNRRDPFFLDPELKNKVKLCRGNRLCAAGSWREEEAENLDHRNHNHKEKSHSVCRGNEKYRREPCVGKRRVSSEEQAKTLSWIRLSGRSVCYLKKSQRPCLAYTSRERHKKNEILYVGSNEEKNPCDRTIKIYREYLSTECVASNNWKANLCRRAEALKERPSPRKER